MSDAISRIRECRCSCNPYCGCDCHKAGLEQRVKEEYERGFRTGFIERGMPEFTGKLEQREPVDTVQLYARCHAWLDSEEWADAVGWDDEASALAEFVQKEMRAALNPKGKP